MLIVARNERRCKAAAQRIRDETGNAAVKSLNADLSSQMEVRRLAEEAMVQLPRLDILINNAGAMFGRRELSVDGIEMTFALNHLAYFLLTDRLLEPLRSSGGRIVNVASEAHRNARMDFDDLQADRRYRGWNAYRQSKLANLLFTYELARRLAGSSVTVNAVHPGFVATRIGEAHGFMPRLAWRMAAVAALRPENGAKTSVHAAMAADVAGVTGVYFVKSRPVPSSPASQDKESARRLWRISEELTGNARSSGPSDSPSATD